MQDETTQEATATPETQEQEAEATPETEVNLDDLSPEELKEYARQKEEEFATYRKNSEKGVQKLLQKTKGDDLEERARAIATEELDKRLITSTLTSVKNQLGSEQRAAFEAEYQFLTEGRKINSENLDTYVKKALDYISEKNPTFVGASVGSSTPQPSKTEAKKRAQEAKEFTERFGL